MKRYEFLRRLHSVLRPRSYLEIGVRDGRSLALSRAPTIAIDPAFRVTTPVRCDLNLVQATSDDFFARSNPLAHLRSGRNPFRNLRRGRPAFGHYLGEQILDLAFIDGMHLLEYALRDFINVERFGGWTSVVVVDDVLPRTVAETNRGKHGGAWTGDIYKLVGILGEHRPDLLLLPIDVTPTGLLLILGADPASGILADRFDALAAAADLPDPQPVPRSVLEREGAIDPQRFLDSAIPRMLVRGRARHRGRAGLEAIRTQAAALTLTSGVGGPEPTTLADAP